MAMSAQLTLSRRRYRNVHPEMDRLVARAGVIRTEALALIESDANAYAELLGAYGLPQASPGERDARDQAVTEAARAASQVPAAVGELAVEVIELAEIAVARANPHVRSDAAAGASFARSAIRVCEMNIAANIGVVGDDAARAELECSRQRFREALLRADAAVDGVLSASPS